MKDFFSSFISRLPLACSVASLGWTVAASFALLAGCGDPNANTIAFEVAYVQTSAWPPKVEGYYVTHGGDLFRYDYYSNHDRSDPAPERSAQMSADEIKATHGSSPKQIGSVPSSDAAHHADAIGAAYRDVIVIQKNVCTDGGRWSYIGYYDLGGGMYAPTLFGLAGDRAGLNAASGAKEAVAWLRELSQTDQCQYATGPCSEGACQVNFPTCTSTTEGANWLDNTHCEEVPDCRACSGNGCLIDASGKKHCSYIDSCAKEEPICASLASSCSGLPGTGLTCTTP